MTIKEIAKLAQTSRGTVDRVINKRGNVSKDVRDRILKVLEETGYKPNQIARSLSLSSKKLNIGVVIGTKGNPFFKLVLDGILNASGKNYNSLLNIIVKELYIFDKEAILKALEELKEEGLDGLIITATNDERIISAINDLNVPTITLSSDIDVNKISYVGCDYYNSGALIANFVNLIKPCGTNLALVIGSNNHLGQVDRVNGFTNTKNDNIRIKTIKETYDDELTTYNEVKTLISDSDLELIIFLGAGISGGLRALEEANTNIKAITVDLNEEILAGLSSGLVLCTINQHPYTQGVRSLDLLHEYLIGKKEIEERKIFDNTIILKESIIPHKLNN